jgi:hypothetical protein
MRSRLLFALVTLSTLARLGHAQSTDRYAGGLTPGDYVRVSAGVTTPANPQGSFREWGQGTGVNVTWQNWSPGGTGVGRLGFSIGATYSVLPFEESQFIEDFTPLSGGKAASASAGNGGLIEVTTGLNIRIPAPLVVPVINFGIGFINWRPSKVSYSGPTGAGTTEYRSRSGAEAFIGAGLERYFAGRFGIFADAAYIYGYTSLGRTSTTPGSICGTSGCDVLKNTSVTTLRGGLSVRVN